MSPRKPKTEKIDCRGKHKSGFRKFVKTRVIRDERRAAKQDPEAQPLYGKNFGYSL